MRYNSLMKAGQTSPTNETYQEWQLAYDHFNKELFKGELPYCLITLQREKHTMGYFSQERFSNRKGRKTDEIAINPSYFAVCKIEEALQTLVHEMCHLWQYHLGSPGRGRYHNKQWADKMESIGLMPSSTGEPGGKRTGDKIADYIIKGGLLEHSIHRLKHKGFELQWMDRYVAQPIDQLDPYFQVAAQQTGVQSPVLNTINETLNSDSLCEAQELAETLDLNFSRTVQKQGTRIKYSCECGINIWAKPNINVTCNDCGQIFEDSSYD